MDDKIARTREAILSLNEPPRVSSPTRSVSFPSQGRAVNFYAKGGAVKKMAYGGEAKLSSFGAAFKAARAAMLAGNGGKEFTFNGKKYSTRLKEEDAGDFNKKWSKSPTAPKNAADDPMVKKVEKEAPKNAADDPMIASLEKKEKRKESEDYIKEAVSREESESKTSERKPSGLGDWKVGTAPKYAAKGGKVKKTKSDNPGFLDKKRDWITDDNKPGEKGTIRDVGRDVKNVGKYSVGTLKDIVTGGGIEALEKRHKNALEGKFAKGGKVKCAPSKKSKSPGSKKVMGTVGEAKQIMDALKRAKQPSMPPPGIGMPMKRGGKAKSR